MIKKIVKLTIISLVLSAPFLLSAQVAESKSSKAEDILDINVILAVVALVMVLPLYLSTRAFLTVAKDKLKQKTENRNIGKVLSLLIMFFFVQAAIAQTGEIVTRDVPKSEDLFSENTLRWILATVIFLEAFLMVYFNFLTTRLLKPAAVKLVSVCPEAVTEKNTLQKLWERMNRFRPIAEEAHLDTGHSYDGIRELNNITPPWFSSAFLISIVFAIVYLYVYHVGKSAPLQIEEYNIELAEAEKEKALMLSSQANNVDENNVTLLDASEITNGKALFVQKCAACHGATGGSVAGGVGPNLTDEYWLHGGSIKDVFKSVKYGWVEKGMIAWKDQLSAKQIAQVTSFIMSIRGSNPAGAKEPQGELYTEEKTTEAKDSTQTDSSKIK